MEKVLLLPWI